MQRSRKDARRRAWFEAGVRDLAATFGTLTGADGGPLPPAYACPLCAVTEPDGRVRMRLFPVNMLGTLLTLEDVPPKHVGGRPLVLTCRNCNNTAGHGIDAWAHRVESSIRALSGLEAARGWLRVGEDRVPAEIDSSQPGVNQIRVLGGAKTTLTRIGAYFTAQTAAPTGEMFGLSVTLADPNGRLAKVSWLKSAYLAVFAMFGYRYALHSFLAPVRRQIQHPQEEHLTAFAFRLLKPVPFSQCRVFRVARPELPACWGVLMGPVLVFLPDGEPDRLYQRLAELKAAGAEFDDFTAEQCLWPLEPRFALAEWRFGSPKPTPRGAVEG